MIRIKEVYVRWIGIFALSIFAIFFEKSHYAPLSWYKMFLVSVTFCGVLWNGSYFIIIYFRKKFPEISQTAIRLTLTVFFVSVFMIVGAIPIRLVFGYMELDQICDLSEYTSHMSFNFGSAAFFGMIYEASYFFQKWKISVQHNEELKNQQIRTQFGVLQNQMSPHFLFNSLNTLTSLIAENPQLAIDFTQKLSEVYRYILQNKTSELVSLKEESDFAESYVYLLKMRYPENLTIELDYAKDEQWHIAPMTIQMLLENAIKHNVVSGKFPLKVSVTIASDYLVVSNKVRKKTSLETSTKTGLENIEKRYELLSDRRVKVVDGDNFTVKVPLIKLIE
ncbi:MAG: histidine kinase [Cyclobacteriaceae bacterium]